MRKTIWTVAVLVTLIWGSTTQAAGTPEQKCQQAKLKAQGKLKSCLAKNAAGVVVGKLDEAAECQTKFTTALAKADTKASDAGASCRYMDNGDGTVSDLNTGLVWEKKTDDASIHDKDNSYTWSTGSPYPPNGTAFTTFLYGLNGGTSSDGSATSGCFTGHCDWRLPTIEELRGILLSAYPCGTNPCIDPAFGPTQSDFYWSATTYAGFPDDAWFVDFDDGNVSNDGKPTDYYARAVRGGL